MGRKSFKDWVAPSAKLTLSLQAPSLWQYSSIVRLIGFSPSSSWSSETPQTPLQVTSRVKGTSSRLFVVLLSTGHPLLFSTWQSFVQATLTSTTFLFRWWLVSQVIKSGEWYICAPLNDEISTPGPHSKQTCKCNKGSISKAYNRPKCVGS